MSGLLVGPFAVELRVYHPELNRVEFVKMEGRNAGQAIHRAAEKWPGWVVTRADEPLVFEDTPAGEHKWNHDMSACVKCGVKEWHAPAEDDCSGVYGLL